jgi:hypothetical protein
MIVYIVAPFLFSLSSHVFSFLLGVEFAECLVWCGVSYPTHLVTNSLLYVLMELYI